MRIVDHEERRLKIAQTAMDVIADEGMEAATLRRNAEEMGASIRVITHYFADKEALLLWIYRLMAMKMQERVFAVIGKDPKDLVGVLMSICGADEEVLKRWRVYVAFWDKAARNGLFAAEQRRWIESALTTVGNVILARDGTCAEPRQAAMELIAVVQGISIQRMFDPGSWSLPAIQAVIARQVADMGRA